MQPQIDGIHHVVANSQSLATARPSTLAVLPGLVPAIHAFPTPLRSKGVDGGHKAGHDVRFRIDAGALAKDWIPVRACTLEAIPIYCCCPDSNLTEIALYDPTKIKRRRRNMFDGFKRDLIETSAATICARYAGTGPPVLLLHGHPQTHVMWHLTAPALAEDYTVVCADLRGYGDSSNPPTTSDHEPYSKRAMARDMIEVMQSFGFERFTVIGHDRGGRVAYRMALDHPDRVQGLAVLDIAPTGEMFRRADMSFGLGYWHWFFLAQPFDLPERVIGANPDGYYFHRGRRMFDAAALAEYRRCYTDPATIHAMCEDYRAGATFDFELDEADRKAGNRIRCPLLALWGAKGHVHRWYDVLEVWRDWADQVQGQPLDCGHYLAEEAPDATLAALRPFLAEIVERQGATGTG
jgi:haloacetate dehalogenase